MIYYRPIQCKKGRYQVSIFSFSICKLNNPTVSYGTRSVSLLLLDINRTTKSIINWVVPALNADWLKAVVYQTLYHGYDKTFICTALIMLVTSL